MIPVDSYTYIVDHLKLLLCDSLNRPISIGLIFLCGNESTFHLISAEISATPKSARLKFEQPLNCGFVTGLQKPYKPLCGRRCRPLCPARGKQGNPSLSPAYFRTACLYPQGRAETAPNGSLLPQGLCLPDLELHLATRGATGADTAVFYISGTSGVCSISLPSKYSANTSAFFSAVSCRERCA